MFVLDKLVTAELEGDEAEVNRWKPEYAKLSRMELVRFSPLIFSICPVCRSLHVKHHHPYPEPDGKPDFVTRHLDREGHGRTCCRGGEGLVFSSEEMFRAARQARFEFGETPVP
jgi:hypothetical protein